MNNFITRTPSGLYCPAGDFFIDPKKPVAIALISHAHGDHAVSTRGQVYCTDPTKSFMTYRQRLKSLPDFNIVDYGLPFSINGIRIIFYPAGHMLGSAQILFEYDGERYLYTGDFKIQTDESCERFEFIECDHLITETTFASPEYIHPDPVKEMVSLCDGDYNVVIGAYVLGKAQRLTKLINTYCQGVTVFVHPQIEPYHKFYEDHGFSPGNWKSFRRDDFEKGSKNIYIVPPVYFKRFISEKNVLKVFATGWKQSPYKCDRILQVSDHADWNDILEVIEKSKAKKVYTVHGNGTYLKEYLKDKIDVKILG